VHVEFKGEVVQAGGMLGFLETIPQNEALVVQVGSQDSHEILDIRDFRWMYEKLGLKLFLSHLEQKTGIFSIGLQLE
jgi:hypothetical protein